MLSNQRLPDGVYIQTINTTSINSITPKRNVNGFIALYYFKILLPQKANSIESVYFCVANGFEIIYSL